MACRRNPIPVERFCTTRGTFSVITTEWPDPVREADKGKPDIGAVPLGVTGWGVGVDGRISVFGGTPKKVP
jgi:hypothetical protein